MRYLITLILCTQLCTPAFAANTPTTFYSLNQPEYTDLRWDVTLNQDLVSIDSILGIISRDVINISSDAVNWQNNRVSTDAILGKLTVDNVGTNPGIEILQSTANPSLLIRHSNAAGEVLHIFNPTNTSSSCINASSANSLTTGSIAYFLSNSPDTGSRNLVYIINDHVSADAAIPLKLQQDGAAVQIQGHGNENLSNSGVWTDRTSTYADKEDIEDLVISGYIDKLKALKLFSYKKKCEVYGNIQETEEDGKKVKKYPKTVKHQNARTHKGYILDDLSTPEELISRNHDGEIDGMSGTQNSNFLLAVCKELILKIEELEQEIDAIK